MLTTSIANERVKYARALQRERVRDREQRFVVEGVRLVEEALRAGAKPVMAFYTDRLAGHERGADLLAALQARCPHVVPVSDRVMASLSDTVTPQGVLAVLPIEERPWPLSGPVLVLDGLRDPGNAGTVLRTAWAAGVQGLAALAGTVDLYAPKVVRAAMGAHFHLSLRSRLDVDALLPLLGERRVALAEPSGQPYWSIDWLAPHALILGGEARGAEATATLAEERVGVPMAAGVESLNAAVAAGIILFEARRQRLAARPSDSEHGPRL